MTRSEPAQDILSVLAGDVGTARDQETVMDLRKRLIRDLRAAHPDLKHTELVRVLEHAAGLRPDPPAAWGRLVPADRDGTRWWKTETRPVGGKDWGTKFAPLWEPEGSSRFETGLRRGLDLDGWMYPGPWPQEPAAALLLPLWRSERGQREDAIDAIHTAVGKSYHMVQELYADAVADALDRAGVTCSDWFANPDEPRTLTIELKHPGDYAAIQITWNEERGWYWVPFADDQTAMGYFDADLDVAHLALPGDVAAAVLNDVTTADKPATEPAAWTAPDDYTQDPDLPGDDMDYSIELERSLAAYASHPAQNKA